MNEIVHGIVARLGGSYSAEHGVGQLKRGLLARWKDPASLAMMRQIKAALDPNGVMNPGKVLVTAPLARHSLPMTANACSSGARRSANDPGIRIGKVQDQENGAGDGYGADGQRDH